MAHLLLRPTPGGYNIELNDLDKRDGIPVRQDRQRLQLLPALSLIEEATMGISIWRQFSSNHSANFTVVGQFETPERAHEVAEEMRAMLRAIGEWWEQYPGLEGQIEHDLGKRGQLTPPEAHFKEQYGVAWPQSEQG